MTGTLVNPGIGTLDPSDPALRYVDLTTVHISEAKKMELPAWARAVIPGPAGAPLLYAGTLAGRPAAVLAFEPRRSDLPLQVAFPILLANLAGELLGGSRDAAGRHRPGRAGHPGHPGRRHRRPRPATGRHDGRPHGAHEGRGQRHLRPDRPPRRLHRDRHPRSRGHRRGPHAHAGRVSERRTLRVGRGGIARRVAGSPSPTFRPADPSAPARFAVDLLDVDESNIAPGDIAALTALGQPAASPGPGASGDPASGAATPGERPQARDELWIPIVLVALLVLTLEWLVYERDTLARLRRAVVARVRRAPPAGRGA